MTRRRRRAIGARRISVDGQARGLTTGSQRSTSSRSFCRIRRESRRSSATSSSSRTSGSLTISDNRALKVLTTSSGVPLEPARPNMSRHPSFRSAPSASGHSVRNAAARRHVRDQLTRSRTIRLAEPGNISWTCPPDRSPSLRRFLCTERATSWCRFPSEQFGAEVRGTPARHKSIFRIFLVSSINAELNESSSTGARPARAGCSPAGSLGVRSRRRRRQARPSPADHV